MSVDAMLAKLDSQALDLVSTSQGFIYRPLTELLNGERQSISNTRDGCVVTGSYDSGLSDDAQALVAAGVTDVFTPYVPREWPFLGSTAIRLWPLPLFEGTDNVEPHKGMKFLREKRFLSDLWWCVAHNVVPVVGNSCRAFHQYWLPGNAALWSQAVLTGSEDRPPAESQRKRARLAIAQLQLLYSPEYVVYDLLRCSLNPEAWVAGHGAIAKGGVAASVHNILHEGRVAPDSALTRLNALVLEQPESALSVIKRNADMMARVQELLAAASDSKRTLFYKTVALYRVIEL